MMMMMLFFRLVHCERRSRQGIPFQEEKEPIPVLLLPFFGHTARSVVRCSAQGIIREKDIKGGSTNQIPMTACWLGCVEQIKGQHNKVSQVPHRISLTSRGLLALGLFLTAAGVPPLTAYYVVREKAQSAASVSIWNGP